MDTAAFEKNLRENVEYDHTDIPIYIRPCLPGTGISAKNTWIPSWTMQLWNTCIFIPRRPMAGRSRN